MGMKDLRAKKWFGVVTNIYVVVLTAFVIWMVFFDSISLIIHLKKQIKTLEKQQEFLRSEIEQDKKTLEKLSDPKELEKFAREHYYLKKKNEEIYLIEYEDSLKNKQDDDEQ
ncbi:septum formation initiator family protein [uncultured Muriicola sp.]|uniref:FtsB family cell division protein n=1 Tax=uncultured Muriicola sp. TaxID=1583102 RepID=UPI0026283A8E|nr:septum formation initiator family protein [uncultured Muriicola sp.]